MSAPDEMQGPGTPVRRRLRLRRPDRCIACDAELPEGSEAWWERATRSVYCLACGEQPAVVPDEPIDVGIAGASARRQWERRHQRREQQIRQAHPRLGGLILALSNDPQSTTAWGVGAIGEELLGRHLNTLASERCVPLHDRRIRRSRANIDHLVVMPTRVYVIDAKRYQGEVRRRDVGSFFRQDVRLYVGRRDCSKLIASTLRQAQLVREALAGVEPAPLVVPILCFVEARWGLFAKPLVIDDVIVTWPKALAELIQDKCREGSVEDAQALARHLADAFPSAAKSS